MYPSKIDERKIFLSLDKNVFMYKTNNFINR